MVWRLMMVLMDRFAEPVDSSMKQVLVDRPLLGSPYRHAQTECCINGRKRSENRGVLNMQRAEERSPNAGDPSTLLRYQYRIH